MHIMGGGRRKIGVDRDEVGIDGYENGCANCH
jgi:hypothetical protein